MDANSDGRISLKELETARCSDEPHRGLQKWGTLRVLSISGGTLAAPSVYKEHEIIGSAPGIKGTSPLPAPGVVEQGLGGKGRVRRQNATVHGDPEGIWGGPQCKWHRDCFANSQFTEDMGHSQAPYRSFSRAFVSFRGSVGVSKLPTLTCTSFI